jgi:hypothetical protein
MKAQTLVKAEPPVSARPGGPEPAIHTLSARHLQLGWWSLLFFLVLGVVLEALHGFKVGLYLNASNETRRLMWTLAHAHGTLIALVQVAFGLTLRFLPAWDARRRALAGRCLIGANLLLPGGFLLGGLFLYGGDPGLGILLVPAGAVLLFIAVFLTARAFKSSGARGGRAE